MDNAPIATPSAELLQRYLAGETAPAETERVRLWIDANPVRQRGAEALKTLDPVGSAEHNQMRTDVLWGSFVQRIASRPSPAHEHLIAGIQQRRADLGGRLSHRGLRYAIAALVVATVAIVLAYRPSDVLHRTPALSTYATAAGQQATVALAHGSRMVLGPATTVSIATDKSTGGRTVTVSGEALFTLVHDPRSPFTVHAGNAVANVLGTTLFVRHYAKDSVARVVVTEGRVSLQSRRSVPSNPSVVLVTRSLGTVDDSGRVHVTPNIAVDDYTAWTTGRLVFNKSSMRDIVAELSRVYGVDIQVADSTQASRVFTWTVPVARQSLADVLEAITAALGAHVTRSGNVITILPGAGPSRQSPIRQRVLSSKESLYGR